MKKILMFLLCLLVGCGAAPIRSYNYTEMPRGELKKEIKVHIDKDYSFKEKVEIKKSLGEWEYVFNGQIKLRIVDEEFDMSPVDLKEGMGAAEWFILRIRSDNKINNGDVKGKRLAFCDKLHGNLIYLLMDRLKVEDIRPVMLHEIGHLMGIDHNVGSDLMDPYYYKGYNFNCVGWDTVRQVALINQLEIRKLNYCLRSDLQ